MYAKWKAELLTCSSVRQPIKTNISGSHGPSKNSQPIAEDELGVVFGDAAEDIRGISIAIHAHVLASTASHPFRVARNCPDEFGWKR